MGQPANIYLTGMMGSGKTSVGRILSRLLQYSFVDLDEELEKSEKLTVAEIFRSKGQSYFRSVESQILSSVTGNSKQVVSTGGGVILNPDNVKLMRDTGKIVYLKTSASSLLKRLEGSSVRPLLAGDDWKKKVQELLDKRTGFCESCYGRAICCGCRRRNRRKN